MWGVIFQNPKKRAKGFRIVKLPDFHRGCPRQNEFEVFAYLKLYIPRKSIILEAPSLDGKDYHEGGTLPVCRCLLTLIVNHMDCISNMKHLGRGKFRKELI